MPDQTAKPRVLVYRKRHRLTTDAQYRAVYEAKIRKAKGPIAIFIKPNTLPQHRLGLSVGRRIGNAVARGKIKRLLREAFRHERSGLPVPPQSAGESAYDIIITVRPHTTLPLAAYREVLVDLVTNAAREHEKRQSKQTPNPTSTPT